MRLDRRSEVNDRTVSCGLIVLSTGMNADLTVDVEGRVEIRAPDISRIDPVADPPPIAWSVEQWIDILVSGPDVYTTGLVGDIQRTGFVFVVIDPASILEHAKPAIM